MRQRVLGSSGPEVSAQGLGCMGMTFGYGPVDEDDAFATLRRALDLGISLFDTADMYGPFSNERLVGRAIGQDRDSVAISSKVGAEIDDDGVITGRVNGRPEYLRKCIDGTLQRLGTDRIDLYYLHRVDPQVPVEESIGAMAEFVAAGKVRSLGLSEASADSIRRAHAVHPLAAVQTEFSLFTRDVETNGVLAAVTEAGIGFVAYSPLGRGMLSGRISSLDDLPQADFRRVAPRFQGDNLDRNLQVVRRIVGLARDKGVTPAQLAIAWVLAQGDNVVALPGTKRPSYLEENVAADGIRLTAQELADLDSAAPPGVAVGDRYPASMMLYVEK
ncbi:aldo/keto reductase [Actinacidiphila bryophytorum]|uniref:aldo/keto reductase n=1 Tax=Actinacidiphila bryophytorum TaxID=1436133 RepID=UPI002176D6B1|nr:aldo/keto reductase [Actinacidiphila bryophytorum]UWE13870.1 aldo/keto reductase [Actinacidiphila bryophytorum]